MSVIIGLDIGTTSTRAIVFDFQGNVLHAQYQEYPILNLQPTYSEQNPDEIFAAVLHTLRQVLVNLNPTEVAGIGFSSAMHSLLAVNAQGQPLTNSIIWADNRSQAQADALRNTLTGQDIYHYTGTPIHPMIPLSKLMWLRQYQPAIFAAAHKFISIKEYVWYKLFGTFQVDYSVASATGLFNIYTYTWYAPALAVASITPTQLSEPVSPLHQATNLLPACAQALGLTNQYRL